MVCKITCIPGDGIGPEIVTQAKKVLDRVASVYGHEMNYTDILMGGASIDVHGVPLTQEAIDTAKAADAVLMGSIWPSLQSTVMEPNTSSRRCFSFTVSSMPQN